MKQKPDPKSIVILNLVNNIPMAIVMSLAAPLIMRIPLVFSNFIVNVLIAFVIACILNIIIPVPRIAEGFPKLFKVSPQSLGGRILGNIPISLIFVVIIGLVLNLYNVRQFPAFIFAFLGTFAPIYVVCFVLSMITNPIAIKLAFGTENR